MSNTPIQFHSEDSSYILPKKTIIRLWLTKIAKQKGFKIEYINYVFCSDSYLHKINVEFLNHDTYTDIITFDQREALKSPRIEADIFISIDRVKENAQTYQIPFSQELRRVMAHGLLHLCGYKDKKKTDAAEMRKQEQKALALYNTFID